MRSRYQLELGRAAGDGLVKVWDAQSGECAATLDNHIDRVWALAVKPKPLLSEAEQKRLASKDSEMADADDEDAGDDQVTLISGSADSTLTFWNDTTAFTAQQATTQATARIEQDQELQNHIRANNYREAIVLALQLNHPGRLLTLFNEAVDVADLPGLSDRPVRDALLAQAVGNGVTTEHQGPGRGGDPQRIPVRARRAHRIGFPPVTAIRAPET